MELLTHEAQKRVGKVLRDRWTIDALIGVGGMAAVYKATHRNGNEVAIKVLHSDISDNDTIRKRFQREGYVANRVKHRGAVTVFDDDTTEDGCAFLVMELLTGENVEARRERLGGFVPLPEVLGIADQVLEVLAAAHAQGIVHRDIKPENLFLTGEGVVKVLDFGIARLQAGGHGTNLTMAGAMIGTPGFMSPEQAAGRGDEIDAKTDIWGLGATLFTLLCGRQVHEAETLGEALILVAAKPARSLSSVLPDLDSDVVALVDKALAFKRDARWPDAVTMQRQLRRTSNRVLGREHASSNHAVDLRPSRPPPVSVGPDSEAATLILQVPDEPADAVAPVSTAPVSEEPPTRVRVLPAPVPDPAPEPDNNGVAELGPRPHLATEAQGPEARLIAIAAFAGILLLVVIALGLSVAALARRRQVTPVDSGRGATTIPSVDLVPLPPPEPEPVLEPVPETDAGAAVNPDASVLSEPLVAPSEDAGADADASVDAPAKPPPRRPRRYRKKPRPVK
ncbi:MAG: protein kinase [Myxococcales bacterium]|nr:protein kinase [Myxococcales bacterium]